MLIIALRKLTSKQKQNIKEHYKTIVFDKRLHLRKPIDMLKCEVLIVELDLSRVFSLSKNVIYKWIKEQDIVNITTAFIYESTKYKKLFDKHVNYFVRTFPELFKKNIEQEVKDKALKDETVKSKYEPHNDDILNELNNEIINLSTDARLEIIESRLDALEKLVVTPINKKYNELYEKKAEMPTSASSQSSGSTEAQRALKKQLKYTIHEEKNNFIIKSSDDVVVITYPFKNKIEKRKMNKKAQNFLNNLTSNSKT